MSPKPKLRHAEADGVVKPVTHKLKRTAPSRCSALVSILRAIASTKLRYGKIVIR